MQSVDKTKEIVLPYIKRAFACVILRLVRDRVVSLYCKPGTWLGLTLRVLGKSGYVYYLSMTSNSGFLEDEVCTVLFAMTFCYELGVI